MVTVGEDPGGAVICPVNPDAGWPKGAKPGLPRPRGSPAGGDGGAGTLGGGVTASVAPRVLPVVSAVISPMVVRQTARMMPSTPVSFARSFCILAPMSELLLPPPNALVRPVSFESWIKIRPIRSSIAKKTTMESKYQATSIHAQAKRFISGVITPPGTADLYGLLGTSLLWCRESELR